MRRLTTIVSAFILVLAAGAAFAIAQDVVGGNGSGSGQSAANAQYTGKRCGNPNTGPGVPPGNPSNTDCPVQSQQSSSGGKPKLAFSAKRGSTAGCTQSKGLRVGLAGADTILIKSVVYKFRGKTLAKATKPPFKIRVATRLRSKKASISATATLTDGRTATYKRTLGNCSKAQLAKAGARSA